jgi:hypothetical protein
LGCGTEDIRFINHRHYFEEFIMSKRYGSGGSLGFSTAALQANKGLLIGGILFIALIAFEVFNFDTTQFALQSLLGNVAFLGLQWATILAIAFCAIDFAGLNRLFTPEGSTKEQREVWFLMGAWLLGATMNAVMTWWAVSVTLLGNDLGNEILSRQQILRFVPIFVAVLVWLTRILFIGSLSIAGESLFGGRIKKSGKSNSGGSARQTQKASTGRAASAPARIKAAPKRVTSPAPKQATMNDLNREPIPTDPAPSRSSRVKQRPPRPNAGLRRSNSGMQAQARQ